MRTAWPITLVFAATYLAITPAFFTTTATIDDANFYLLPFLGIDDPLVEIARYVASPGWHVLMLGLNSQLDVIPATRVIQLLAAVLYLYWSVRLGDDRWGWWGGLVSGTFGLCSSFLVGLLAGGIPHSFVPGAFMWLLHGVLAWDRAGVASATLFAGLFCPQAMAIGGLYSLIQWTRESLREWRLYAALGIALAWVAYCPVVQRVSLEELAQMREMHEGGRGDWAQLKESGKVLGASVTAALWWNRDNFRVLVEEREQKAGWVMEGLRAWRRAVAWEDQRGGVAGALWVLLALACIQEQVGLLMLVMGVCYLLSSSVAYALYVPARFWEYGMVAIVTMAWVILAARLPRASAPTILLGSLGITWALGGPGVRPNNGFGWAPWEEQRGLFEFAKTTDPGSMWAGPLKDPGTIGLSLYARRKTYVTWETAVPWRRDVYLRVARPRIEELCRVYWSGRPTKEFRYLIVRKSDYRGTAVPDRWVFEPFQSEIRFARPVWDREVVYEDGLYQVLDMERPRFLPFRPAELLGRSWR